MADKTQILLVCLHEVFSFSQLSKGINNNTKQNVVQNNLEEQEKTNIKY